ncbi:MAG: TraR/DksA C4-type zinc finger protein [Puia sp.]|nr:TraR/DksA C4-type zinc finger protein [Puia sp.]
MASKKKAAKPAKKPINVKKAAPPKKSASKPAQVSAPKGAKKPVAGKNTVKPVAKKAAPATKKPVVHATGKAIPAKAVSKPVAPASKHQPAVSAKHPASAPAKHPAQVIAKQQAPAGKPAVKEETKKPLAAKIPEKKEEPKPAAPIAVAPKPAEPKKPPVPAKPVKVVIPEIKTKTVRKYEPEFTKSVLDTPQEEQTGPTMRYSDSELTEFRELINKKLDAAKKELAYLQGLITRKDEMGGDNDDARYMTMEDGSMSMEREQLSQMASRQITFIDHLEKAIMRIENKTYGICRVTGKLIDKARLRAVPHATLSIEAKQMMNK